MNVYELYTTDASTLTNTSNYFTATKTDNNVQVAAQLFTTQSDVSDCGIENVTGAYAIKMESTTKISFTNDTPVDVAILVRLRYDAQVTETNKNVIKFDGETSEILSLKKDVIEWKNYSGVAAGTHTIERGGNEVEVVYVKVTKQPCTHPVSTNGTVGATNNSTSWWSNDTNGAFSPFYALHKTEMREFTFDFYGSGDATTDAFTFFAVSKPYHNFDSAWSDGTEYLALRANAGHWGTASNQSVSITSSDGAFNDDQFKTDCQGGMTADMRVASSGSKIYVYATYKAKESGRVYYLTGSAEATADWMYLFFTVANAHIENLKAVKTTKAYEVTYNATNVKSAVNADGVNVPSGTWLGDGESITFTSQDYNKSTNLPTWSSTGTQGTGSSETYTIASLDATSHVDADLTTTGKAISWDFTSVGNPSLPYEANGITVTGLNANDKIDNYGYFVNGASKTSGRFIKFTPTDDGVLTVYGYKNTNDASTLIAVGTSVVLSAAPEVGKDGVVSWASITGTGINNTGSFTADLIAGQTYYVYFPYNRGSITRLEYRFGDTDDVKLQLLPIESEQVDKGGYVKNPYALYYAGNDEKTSSIPNPTFNGNADGWTVTVGATNSGYQSSGYPSGTENPAFIGFVEAWKNNANLGDGTISPTNAITGLPAGTYVLGADIIATRQGASYPATGVFLFAEETGGGKFKTEVSTGNGIPEHFELTFTKTSDADLTIGLQTIGTTANWIGADNFTLKYYSTAELNVKQGQTVEAVAVPYENYLFKEWRLTNAAPVGEEDETDADGNTVRSFTVTGTGDATIEAVFEYVQDVTSNVLTASDATIPDAANPYEVEVLVGQDFTLRSNAPYATSWMWYQCDENGNPLMTTDAEPVQTGYPKNVVTDVPYFTLYESTKGTYYFRCKAKNVHNNLLASNVLKVTVLWGVDIKLDTDNRQAQLVSSARETIYYTVNGVDPVVGAERVYTLTSGEKVPVTLFDGTSTDPNLATVTIKAIAYDATNGTYSTMAKKTFVHYPMEWKIFDDPATSLHTWNSIGYAKGLTQDKEKWVKYDDPSYKYRYETNQELFREDLEVQMVYTPGPEIDNAAFSDDKTNVVKEIIKSYENNTGAKLGLQPVTKWTPISTNTEAVTGGVFEYGSDPATILLNSDVPVPATGPSGTSKGVALGIVGVWGQTAQYTQEITLPAGDYKITIPVYNAKTGTGEKAVQKNYFGFIADNGTEYLSTQTTFSDGVWQNMEVSFTLAEETKGKISLGFQGAQIGAAGNPALFVDKVNLQYSGADKRDHTLFHGVYFTSEEKDMAISLNNYRIRLNSKNTAFTLRYVPNDYYIKIIALTDHISPSVERDMLKFVSSATNGATITRVDGPTAGSDPYEATKHTFIYKVSGASGGETDVTFKPTRGSYVYYIGVVQLPTPILDFNQDIAVDISSKNYSERTSGVSVTADAGLSIVVDNTDVTSTHKIYVKWTSDDPTIATVDENTGAVTVYGSGTATITATLAADYDNDGTVDYASDASASYTITVIDGTPSYVVPDGYQPNIWTKVGEVPGIAMYYGGWKYQEGTGDKANANAEYYTHFTETYEISSSTSGSTKSDKWDSAKKYTVGNETAREYQSVPMDGFIYFTSGNNDGKNEFGAEGQPNYAYEHETDVHSKENGWGNPFTVPCAGDFVKFEPEKDGLLTVYILQNGTINFDSDNDNLTSSVSWRPFYVVDEAGRRVKGVKAVTKQPVLISPDDVTTDVYDGTTLMENTTYASLVTTAAKNHSQFSNRNYWPTRSSIETVLSPGDDGTNDTNDGWIVISKAYVKYQFEVKAGKSYYVFSNSSKMGMCGFNFKPADEVPTGEIVLDDATGKVGDKTDAATFISNRGNGTKSVAKATLNTTSAVVRKLKPGWNSICLPFSVTEGKMRKLFGSDGKTEDYELVLFNGSTEKYSSTPHVLRAHFFHHVYQDIIAGFPYMIYVKEGAKAVTEGIEVENVTIEDAPFVQINSSHDYIPQNAGDLYDEATMECFTLTGVAAPTTMPEWSYLVNTGGIYRISEEKSINAFRAYLKYTDTETSGANVRSFSDMVFTSAWNDEAFGDATVINELAAELGIINGPSTIYNLNGQVVRQNSTSLEGLPKGIYIVNGQKYFVK